MIVTASPRDWRNFVTKPLISLGREAGKSDGFDYPPSPARGRIFFMGNRKIPEADKNPRT
jgi:hypothetical protein